MLPCTEAHSSSVIASSVISEMCIFPLAITLKMRPAQLHMVTLNGHYNEFQNIHAHTQKNKAVSQEFLWSLSRMRIGSLTFVQYLKLSTRRRYGSHSASPVHL